MKKIFLFLVIYVALHTSAVKAQEFNENRRISVGFGMEGGVVTGDFKPAHKIGAGLGGRISYELGSGFATLSSGTILLFPRKNGISPDAHVGVWVPFKAGYKFIIGEDFFVMGEAGYSILRYYYQDTYGSEHTTQGGFVWAPTAGLHFGIVEIGLRYQSASIKGARLSMGLVRFGVNF